jgi:excisionase family DNA binding protein
MMAARPEITGRKPSGRRRHAPSERLVYTVPEAGRLLGLSRNASYDAAKRGDIPTLRIGRLLLVPKIPFHRMLGITASVPTSPANPSELAAEVAGAAEEGEEE